MFATRFSCALSGLPSPLAALLPKETTDLLTNKPRKLYETLSRMPRDGVGARVHQTRWTSKGIEGCYWEVSRTKMRREGTRGEAWGRLVWRGKPVSEKEEKIRGSLKYKWAVGESKGENLRAVQPSSSSSVTEQMNSQRLEA